MYATDALASSWGCPKTKLRRKNKKGDILIVLDEILGTKSREFRRTGSLQVVPVSVPKHSLELLPYILPAMFRWPFGLIFACCRMSSSKLIICFTAFIAIAFAAADEDLSPLVVEDLHQQNFYCFNVYLAFSSNPSFRDFAARIAEEY
ncbi:hypothetical protein Tco_0111588 [Tanacetum coccineum]